jgi:flagellar biosynthesis protein FlhF
MVAHNLRTAQTPITDRGGMFALVGPTGVGKTTTTAKIASTFALKHGAASVGLITVDTYRMAAGDQLRAFGRILGIPVHTARDATSLADLLDLLANKKLVLVDTVGVGQRDRRLPELFAALPGHRLERLLVLNAACHGETLDEVVRAYGQGPGTRCVLSKLDEAARCGGAIDVALRHRLVLEGLGTGQRVPEDWHGPRPQLLAHKALMAQAGRYQPDEDELGLLLTMPPMGADAPQEAARA